MIKHEVSAGGIVFKKNKGKVLWLICQHSAHHGWVFPKGLVGDLKKGEKKLEAALRETEEEGGVKGKIIKQLPKPIEYFYHHQGTLIKKTVYYFLMEYLAGDPKNHDWETKEALFLSENEVMKKLTYQSDKEAFQEALKIYYSINKKALVA